MRKRNSVKQLNRTASHRKAMMKNMVTSLFDHERIVTTRAKGKVLRSYAEKLITGAKNNLREDVKPEQKLHQKRELMRHIADRDVIVKLFEDIAPRFKDRNGGYTRVIHLPERHSDASQMSIVELVDRKEKVRKVRAVTAAKASKDTGKEKAREEKQQQKEDKKWFDRFRKKKS
jgi:large subunit ribosomal protein L17